MYKVRFSPILLRVWKTRYEDGETVAEIARDLKETYNFTIDKDTLRARLKEFGTAMRRSGPRKHIEL